MKLQEIIDNLESQAHDRDMLRDKEDEYCQFNEDYECLNEAIDILNKLQLEG